MSALNYLQLSVTMVRRAQDISSYIQRELSVMSTDVPGMNLKWVNPEIY
jgi:hypothetical protein